MPNMSPDPSSVALGPDNMMNISLDPSSVALGPDNVTKISPDPFINKSLYIRRMKFISDYMK